MHERRRIRELVVSILKADVQSLLTIDAADIFDSPSLPDIKDADSYDGGRINVYLLGDTRVGDDRESESPVRYLRESTLSIEINCEKTQTFDAIIMIDGWCEEVEAVMSKFLANNLNNTVQAIEYADTTVQLDDEGDNVYATASVNYEIQFRTEHWESHPDFDGTDVDYNKGAPGDFEDNPIAQDIVDNPT